MEYQFEPGDILWDCKQKKKGVCLNRKENVYTCLDYNLNIFYIDDDDSQKLDCSYALYKVLYDLNNARRN